MRVIHGLDDQRAAMARSVLTIGNFDGVHRGHQEIVARAVACARPTATPVVVLTFEPHPLAVVSPDPAPQLLSRLHQKLEYLGEIGVDATVVADCTPEFLRIEPQRFIHDVVVRILHPLHIVEGPNFGFGRGRAGNAETLARHADQCGYRVHVVDPVQAELPDGTSMRVSSSLIRSLLLEGRAELAARALGRPYALEGEVVAGDHRGRPLGFPTANLRVTAQLVPADGVYAGTASCEGVAHDCAISVGSTPTFGGQTRRVEAHLLDFDGDLYGRTITVHFRRRIRDQRKFGSAQDLIQQIEEDVRQVRQGPT